MKELVCEILCEELPAVPLLKELKNIKTKWQKALADVGLESECEFYYTPRRLVFYHQNFKEKSDDKEEEFIGAPKNVAYVDGKLSRAAESFLQKAGISEDEIEFKEIKGKEVLYAKKIVKGVDSKELLGGVVESFLKSLVFGKSMRWGQNEFDFIRPIQNIACVFGGEVISFECFGVKSNNKTYIHKSLSFEPFSFNSFDEYKKVLKEGKIVLDSKEREKIILDNIALIEQTSGLCVGKDEELLAHIVAITENPRAILGDFEERFLKVPSEAIITSMKDNQKYFAVFDKNGKLSNHFVVVINSISDDINVIKSGNERVLRARLEDALFFYENDLKVGLVPEKLKDMMYVDGLGNMYEKTLREIKVLEKLSNIYQIDLEKAKKAILYSKADLSTQMVGEFGELEGIMGGYYAKAMGFDDCISEAIYEQYLPKGDSDLPKTEFSLVVSLAMKTETLLGLFSKNKIPTGSKDPYALRRAAAASIKIIIKLKKDFDLAKLLLELSKDYGFDSKVLVDFILERLFGLYDENASYIRAAASGKGLSFVSIDGCINAISSLVKQEDISTFKRVANITKDFVGKDIDKSLLQSKEEQKLYDDFMNVKLTNDYANDLKNLLSLKPSIDEFFDKVMINVDDEKLKHNRKALIYSIYDAFLGIADLKELSL